MWRIENLELADVKPNMYGQFYGGDCYLVLYTYLKAGQQHYILYMWEVSDCQSNAYKKIKSIISCCLTCLPE